MSTAIVLATRMLIVPYGDGAYRTALIGGLFDGFALGAVLCIANLLQQFKRPSTLFQANPEEWMRDADRLRAALPEVSYGQIPQHTARNSTHRLESTLTLDKKIPYCVMRVVFERTKREQPLAALEIGGRSADSMGARLRLFLRCVGAVTPLAAMVFRRSSGIHANLLTWGLWRAAPVVVRAVSQTRGVVLPAAECNDDVRTRRRAKP